MRISGLVASKSLQKEREREKSRSWVYVFFRIIVLFGGKKEK